MYFRGIPSYAANGYRALRPLLFGFDAEYVPGKGLEWLPGGCWPDPPPEVVKGLEFAAGLELEAAARPELSTKLKTIANEVLKSHDAEIRKLFEPSLEIHG